MLAKADVENYLPLTPSVGRKQNMSMTGTREGVPEPTEVDPEGGTKADGTPVENPSG